MTTKIAHIADIHIEDRRREEYGAVFERLYGALEAEGVDIIVVAGDVFDNKMRASSNNLSDVIDFLLRLTAIAPVVMIAGNHDTNCLRPGGPDLLTPAVTGREGLQPPRLHYWRSSGVYRAHGIVWTVVAPDGQKPAEEPAPPDGSPLHLCLFHEEINGALLPNGSRLRGFDLSVEDVTRRPNGELYDGVLGGHIHQRQMFTPRAGYCGSLVQQNIGESHLGHGFMLWEFGARAPGGNSPLTTRGVDIPNDCGFLRVLVSATGEDATPSPLPARPRYWEVAYALGAPKPAVDAIAAAMTERYGAPRRVFCLRTEEEEANRAEGGDDAGAVAEAQEAAVSLASHEAFIREILHGSDHLDAVLGMHRERWGARADGAEHFGARVRLLRFEFSNLYKFGAGNVVDFAHLEGCVSGVVAPNFSGKSSLIEALLFTLYESHPRVGAKQKILHSGAQSCSAALDFEIEGRRGRIEKGFTRTKSSQSRYRFTFDGQDLTAGGTVGTLAEIQRVVGGAVAALASSFQLQGTEAGFVASRPAERKQMLAHVLSLGSFVGLEKEVARELAAANGGLRSLGNLYKGTPLAALTAQLAAATAAAREADAKRDEARDKKEALGGALWVARSKCGATTARSRDPRYAGLSVKECSAAAARWREAAGESECNRPIERVHSDAPFPEGIPPEFPTGNSPAPDAAGNSHANFLADVDSCEAEHLEAQIAWEFTSTAAGEFPVGNSREPGNFAAQISDSMTPAARPLRAASLRKSLYEATVRDRQTWRDLNRGQLPARPEAPLEPSYCLPPNLAAGEERSGRRPTAADARDAAAAVESCDGARESRCNADGISQADYDRQCTELVRAKEQWGSLSDESHDDFVPACELRRKTQAADLLRAEENIAAVKEILSRYPDRQGNARTVKVTKRQVTEFCADVGAGVKKLQRAYDAHAVRRCAADLLDRHKPRRGCDSCAATGAMLAEARDEDLCPVEAAAAVALKAAARLAKDLSAARAAAEAEEARDAAGAELERCKAAHAAGAESRRQSAARAVLERWRYWQARDAEARARFDADLERWERTVDAFIADEVARLRAELARLRLDDAAAALASARKNLAHARSVCAFWAEAESAVRERDKTKLLRETEDRYAAAERQLLAASEEAGKLAERRQELAVRVAQEEGRLAEELAAVQQRDVLAAYRQVLKPAGGIADRLLERAHGLVVASINSGIRELGGAFEVELTPSYDMNHRNSPDEEWLPASLSSGYQKFALGLAARLAIWRLAVTPRPDAFVIDEGFGSCDEDNLDALVEALQVLAATPGGPRLTFVVSHVPELKAKLERALEIEVLPGGSRIVQGNVARETPVEVADAADAADRDGHSVPREIPLRPDAADPTKLWCEVCRKTFGVGWRGRHLGSEAHAKKLQRWQKIAEK
jgi:DNA repair exonuclease SbcCD ATPase subunit